jgi:Ca2+/Na+ antiporter
MFMLSWILATTGSHNPGLIVFVLVVLGVVLFFVGFRTYRQYRILADTPLIPVRSAPMGLVHVAGNSTGGQPLTSPLTQVPCYYYDVKVEKLVTRDEKETWETTSHVKVGVPFHLEDKSGKILVNPQHAEFDLPRTFWGELRPPSLLSFGSAPRSFDESLGVPPPTDEHLRAYLAGQLNPARAALEASHIPGAKMMSKALDVAQKMDALGVSMGGGGISMDFGNHRYRLSEFCLVAGRTCNVLGTCAENPAASDETGRNLIRKGENEKTFLITTKSEKQIEKSLRLKAVLLVLLGGAMIVGGVALGLHMAHLL